MHLKLIITALLLSLVSTTAVAQLEPYTDYEISDAIWNITMVKVDPNMGDDYLEGIRDTWVASNKIAKELGQIEDFMIYRSQLTESGDANLFTIELAQKCRGLSLRSGLVGAVQSGDYQSSFKVVVWSTMNLVFTSRVMIFVISIGV